MLVIILSRGFDSSITGLLIGVGMILAWFLVTYSDFCTPKKKESKETKSQQAHYEIMLKRSCDVTDITTQWKRVAKGEKICR